MSDAVAPAPSRDYYQYPQPFALPDLATAPGGRTFTGCRARVYWLLRITRERRFQHRVGRHLAPAGTVPIFLFREPWSGGQSGARRVRELREYGVELRIREYAPPDGDGSSSTTLYELVDDPIAGGGTPGRAPRAPGPVVSPPAPSDGPGPGGLPAHPPERTAAPRPLVQVRFSFGDRPSGTLPMDWRGYDLTPGSREVLAPARGADEAAYRAQLRSAWETGRVEELAWGRRRILFYDSPLLRPRFDLKAVLTTVLEACGASREEPPE